MTDSTPAATPAAPEPTPQGATPLPLNEAQLASLTKTEEICRTALKPDYLTALVTPAPGEEPGDDHVTEAAIRAILTLCEQARGKSSDAVAATGGKVHTTAEETAAKKSLVALLRFFQARARQKHFFKNPAALAAYGIGHDLDNSRALLEGWAQTIYDLTATDKLPHVTEAKRAELQSALATYKATQTGQAGAIGTATGTRLDRDALVKQATAGRMWLQFAADAEWPHTEPNNHPIRREFQLPATRPFIG